MSGNAGTWAGTISTVYLCERWTTGARIDAWIDQVFTSSDPNTPDNWSVDGVPINIGKMIIDGTEKQLGTDYNFNWTKEGHWLYRLTGSVSGS